MIFDLIKSYGFYNLNDVTLEGYRKIIKFEDVLKHYLDNYYEEKEVFKIEKYSTFIFKACLKYLKDLSFV